MWIVSPTHPGERITLCKQCLFLSNFCTFPLFTGWNSWCQAEWGTGTVVATSSRFSGSSFTVDASHASSLRVTFTVVVLYMPFT